MPGKFKRGKADKDKAAESATQAPEGEKGKRTQTVRMPKSVTMPVPKAERTTK